MTKRCTLITYHFPKASPLHTITLGIRIKPINSLGKGHNYLIYSNILLYLCRPTMPLINYWQQNIIVLYSTMF